MPRIRTKTVKSIKQKSMPTEKISAAEIPLITLMKSKLRMKQLIESSLYGGISINVL